MWCTITINRLEERTNIAADRAEIPPAAMCVTQEPLDRPNYLIVYLTHEEKEILAKLLYREAGSMSWEGQVWVCSAIINLGKHSNKSIWQMAHNANMFSVAPIVDSAKPTQMQYEVIDYIQHHGTIPEVKYFRTKHFHRFGTPLHRIWNVYFSK